MKVYVVLIKDRHTDPQAEVFDSAEAAIAFAKREARELARNPEYVEEREVPGWLYYARYSVEGDSVWVEEKTLRRGEQ